MGFFSTQCACDDHEFTIFCSISLFLFAASVLHFTAVLYLYVLSRSIPVPLIMPLIGVGNASNDVSNVPFFAFRGDATVAMFIFTFSVLLKCSADRDGFKTAAGCEFIVSFRSCQNVGY